MPFLSDMGQCVSFFVVPFSLFLIFQQHACQSEESIIVLPQARAEFPFPFTVQVAKRFLFFPTGLLFSAFPPKRPDFTDAKPLESNVPQHSWGSISFLLSNIAPCVMCAALFA